MDVLTSPHNDKVGARGRHQPVAEVLEETTPYLAARQAYLEALPVAAAVVAAGKSSLRVLAHNVRFRKLDGVSTTRGRAGVLARSKAAERIGRVLSGTSLGERFDWRDGGVIDGRHFTVVIAPLTFSPRYGPRALVTLIERTNEVQTGEFLRRQILIDPLTGLPNRAGFIEGLEGLMKEDAPDQFAMMLLDLARFSRVNECIGTLGGDELMIAVARRLLSALRANDLLARTAANEFAIGIKLVDGPGDALHVARRLEAALAQPFRLSDFEIKIDCRIGCSLATDGDGEVESMVRHAQLALKAAKLSDRIEVYQRATLEAARRRFTIETELRRAIERDELTMAFQPLTSLSTGRISGFEALARWEHADYGNIPPAEFIAVAEDSGLIIPLGRWALDRAMKILASWDVAAGAVLPIYMGVNLSPIQIARDDVAASVEDALRSHGIAGARLSVELTESAIIGDPDRAGRTLTALKRSDALIAMDDFGTGFSNLASLQKLPIDVLKIDRSFVTDMLDDPDKVAIVRAVLGLAQALGMTTTAEGVETAELARTLAALGCTTAQGFHFSRALGADEAFDYLSKSLS